MRKIDFLFFDAGGGHRSAATALQMVASEQRRPWIVSLVNLQEILDEMDLFRKVTGLRLQDIYNLLLKKGWTIGSPHLVWWMHLIIRIMHRQEVRLLERLWLERRPDMVVSLIPNFNRAIAESVAKTLPGVPFVTVLTDIADYPPHFWIERESQYVVCGSERAAEQARALGHGEDRILRTSGMILHPRFYQPVAIDRRAERERLGLKPDVPVALVMFGGQGASVMLRIAELLDGSDLELQFVFVCGRNAKLRAALERRAWRHRHIIEGFTTEIPYLMKLADFLIGKPGPGSISEAFEMGLPVIVQCNAWTLPQERYNCEWVREKGAGIVLRSFRHIVPAVREMLDAANFARFRENAARIRNRAIFEIPDMLERILERSQCEK